MGFDEKKRKEFCTWLKKWQDEAHQLEVLAIKGLAEHDKNVYMLLLATVVQYSNITTEDQLLYLKLIAIGNEAPEEAETYLRKANELTQQTIDDFVKAFKSSAVKFYFILDSLILVCLGDRESVAYDYLAGLIDILGLKETEVAYFCKLAKAIVEQDSAGYDEAKGIIDLANLKGFSPSLYLLDFYTGVIIQTDEAFCWWAPTPTEVDITELVNLKAKNILIKNAIISVTHNLDFYGRTIVLENCTWKEGCGTLRFCSGENIQINNCIFKDFKTRVIWIYNIGKMEIIECKFENCYRNYRNSSSDWLREGQVLGTSQREPGIVVIDKSVFKDCGGKNSSQYFRSAFIYDGHCEVRNSRFINCWHYYWSGSGGRVKDPSNSRRTMFLKGTVSENNQISNSADFC